MIKDIHIEVIENIFIEIENEFGENIIIITLYRPPSSNINNFLIERIDEQLENISRENKKYIFDGRLQYRFITFYRN